MKIGIVTFQRAENYGAALQCKALYTYLSEKENDVEIIDYNCISIANAYRIFPRFRKNIFILVRQYISAIVNYRGLKHKKIKFQKYIADFKRTPMMSLEDICNTNLDYDLIIAGSDQIWNPTITNGFDKVYFLNFNGNFKRAGYAISMGDIKYTQYSEKQFSEYISKFDYLSFREPDAAEFISKKSGKRMLQVLDPTLLLTKHQWDNILGNTKMNIPRKYIFVYYVVDGHSSREIAKIADKLSEQDHIPIVYLKMNRDIRNPFKEKSITIIDVGPQEFLYLIKNATYVVTSSFHGTVLSCIYQKDLSVIIPEQKGSRVTAIAEMFHLEDRVYSSYNDFCRRYNESKKIIDTNTKEYRQVLKKSVDYLNEITKGNC